MKSVVVPSTLEQPMALGKFPGFKEIDTSHRDLNIIVKQGLESWQTALSCVAGVYLSGDRAAGEHQLYVGSATGTGGMWQRCTYAHNGHAENIRLRDLHNRRGENVAENFKFSSLEIADKHAGKDEMMHKEKSWEAPLSAPRQRAQRQLKGRPLCLLNRYGSFDAV